MTVVTSKQCLNATRACLHMTEDEKYREGGMYDRFYKAMLNLKRFPGSSGVYAASFEDATVIHALSEYQTSLDEQRTASSVKVCCRVERQAEELTM